MYSTFTIHQSGKVLPKNGTWSQLLILSAHFLQWFLLADLWRNKLGIRMECSAWRHTYWLKYYQGTLRKVEWREGMSPCLRVTIFIHLTSSFSHRKKNLHRRGGGEGGRGGNWSYHKDSFYKCKYNVILIPNFSTAEWHGFLLGVCFATCFLTCLLKILVRFPRDCNWNERSSKHLSNEEKNLFNYKNSLRILE